MSTIEDYYCFEQLDAVRKKIFNRFSDRVINPLVIPECINKYKNTWKKTNEPYVFDWIRAHFNSNVGSLIPLNLLGLDNIIYQFSISDKKYYLKSPLISGISYADLIINHYLSDLIKSETNVFSPKSILVQINNTLMQCMDAVEGIRISRKSSKFPFETLREVGASLWQLKKIPVEGFGPLQIAPIANKQICSGLYDNWFEYVSLNLEHHVTLCLEFGAISKREKNAIQAFFKSEESRFKNIQSVLLHGDLGIHNCIFKNNQLAAILDWGEALIGDPVFQIAYFSINNSFSYVKVLLETYPLVDLLDEEQLFRFRAYQLRFALSMIAFVAIKGMRESRLPRQHFKKIYNSVMAV